MVKILEYQSKHQQEIKRYQEDLESLRLYIQEFTTFLPIAVCTITPIQIIIDINVAFEKLTGFSTLEIIGEPWDKLFLSGREIEEIKKKIAQKKFIQDQELVLITKEKKEISVSVSISIRKDEEENLTGYFLSITDLTTLKKFQEKEDIRAKERLALVNILEDVEWEKRISEEERNKLQAIVFNFTDGLLFFNGENILRIFNPQAEIYFEAKARDVLGKEIFTLSKFFKLNLLLNFLKNKSERIFREELQLEENLVLEITSFPIYTEKGKKNGNLIILHDITREKRIEKTKSEFVSITAHQLRTPLSAIKWTLQMLLSHDLGEITLEQRSFIEKTYKANERVIGVINDLLNVTRIEEGKHLYKLVLTDIKEIVKEIIISHEGLAEKKEIKLELKESKEKLPQVNVDIEKIKLAIQNLIENAIQYSLQKGIVTILLEYGKKEKEIMFQIKDNGIGISKEQQQRLFTKFFRGANAIKMETDGSGLGLFITKNIIETHKGKIGFESEEGKGSTFWFTLPIENNLH